MAKDSPKRRRGKDARAGDRARGVRETAKGGNSGVAGGATGGGGGIGDSAYMQISSCENSDAGGRIVSDKATGSQGQYQSNDEKRVADDPGNARGNRGKKINEPSG